MRLIQRTIVATILSFEELDKEEQILLIKALKVREKAQAPYSTYVVGAAVLSTRGNAHTGCNVERCTLSETTHAEQCAIDKMVSEEGKGTGLIAIAVVGAFEGQKIELFHNKKSRIGEFKELPTPSCGRCLQIILENSLGNPDVRLITPCSNGEILRITLDNAFPLRFGPSDLGINY